MTDRGRRIQLVTGALKTLLDSDEYVRHALRDCSCYAHTAARKTLEQETSMETYIDRIARRQGWKCPGCGDLDGVHIDGCRFSPPYDTDDDIRRYYEAQQRAIEGTA